MKKLKHYVKKNHIYLRPYEKIETPHLEKPQFKKNLRPNKKIFEIPQLEKPHFKKNIRPFEKMKPHIEEKLHKKTLDQWKKLKPHI